MAWKNAPVTVWLFIACMVATLVVAALPGDPTIGSPAVAVFFTCLWSYLLLRRSAAGWCVVTGLYAMALVVLTAMTVWPWDTALAIIVGLVATSLAALLAPQTRAWVNVGHSRQPHAV